MLQTTFIENGISLPGCLMNLNTDRLNWHAVVIVAILRANSDPWTRALSPLLNLTSYPLFIRRHHCGIGPITADNYAPGKDEYTVLLRHSMEI